MTAFLLNLTFFVAIFVGGIYFFLGAFLWWLLGFGNWSIPMWIFTMCVGFALCGGPFQARQSSNHPGQ